MSARSAIAAASLKRGLPLLVVVLGLAVMASPALAAQTHVLEGEIGLGELSTPAGLAVGPSGDLYVADPSAATVLRYDAAGAPLPFAATGNNSLGTLAIPARGTQVAVDNSGEANAGHIYVIDGKGVRAFKANGEAAPFAATAPYISGNRITGSAQAGAFVGPLAVAVDSKGYIYVADTYAVYVFSPSGESLVYFASYESTLLGVESNGIVYAGSTESTEAHEPIGYPPTSNTGYLGVGGGVGVGTSLAVDSANDQVYLGNKSVLQYSSFATGNMPIGEFGTEELRAGTAGLAVDQSGGANDGDVYVSTGAQVDRFGPQVTVPTAVTEPASAVDSATDTATLHGSVNPSGLETTGCEFDYGRSTSYSQTVPCEGNATEIIGEGSDPVQVSADVSGLEPGNYHFRLVARNANGKDAGADQTFAIIGPPIILGESAEPGAAEALLIASINPANSRTTYSFEYGSTSAYGSTTGAATLAAGTTPVRAALGVVGLTPGATYHFRAVASNGFGTVVGADATFTVGFGAGAGGCPNEALRTGYSALLPECRAYEQVSPVDKQGGSVYRFNNNQSTPEGDADEFLSTDTFAGAAAANFNAYIAQRGPSGWVTKGIDAPQSNPAGFVELTSTATSGDLSKTLQTSERALTPGATEGGSNLYLRDNSTGALTLVATEPGLGLFISFSGGTATTPYLGGTPNWSRLFFISSSALTEGEGAVAGATNAYEFTDGRLRVLTVREGGEEVPAISAVASPDGRRLVLAAPNGAQYVSENGSVPAPLTVSHLAGASGEAVPAERALVSGDASTVYFTSQEPLLEEGGAPVGPGALYRLDVATRTLTDLTPSKSLTIGAVEEVSFDGSHLYFESEEALTSDSTPATSPATNLYAEYGGEFHLIVRADPEAWEGAGTAEEVQVSPNGDFFGFTATQPLTPEAVRSPACAVDPTYGNPAGLCRQVYLYTSSSHSLGCLSCARPATGLSHLGAMGGGKAVISGHQSRAVLDNGDVFFESPTALVPADTNGVGDVYMSREGTVSLISTGTSSATSQFAEASADGKNVFFRTSQQLVGQDVDSAVDLYDARVDGGIAAQNPPGSPAPCEGGECRSTGSTPPPPLASSFSQGRCGGLGDRARRAAAKAKRLKKQAADVSGKGAKALRSRAAKERKQAKQLNRKANQCRRQGK